MKLNSRDYPMLPDSFLYDLQQELANVKAPPADRVDVPAEGVALAVSELTVSKALVCTAVTFGRQIVASWVVPGPDGFGRALEVTLPADTVLRDADKVAEVVGLTQPDAETLFGTLWGMP